MYIPPGQIAATVAQVRTQISDTPKWCVRAGRYELVDGPCDGVQTVFYFRFFRGIIASLVVGVQVPPPTANAAPPTWTQVPAGGLDIASIPAWAAGTDPNGWPIVTFATAPPQGTILGLRYLVTALTDAEIATYLPDSPRSTLTLTLKAVHYELIPVILADRESSMVYRINDRTDDPTNFTKNLLALRAMIKDDLDSEPGEGPAGGSGSWYGHGFGSSGSYLP